MINPFGGILIVNKPEDKTSTYVDRFCKKLPGVKKVGHIGTLDPFATGVLAIAINFGTKAIPYIKTARKKYEFEIKFGEKTDTADKTGNIIKTSEFIPSILEIEKIIPQFIGVSEQVPPAFSAIKINGKRAYDLARVGQKPDIKKRSIEIFDLKLLSQTDEKTFKFVTEVSPGTYIRTLCENIAESLNTFGHASSLHRTQDGRFKIENAVSLDELNEKRDNIEGIMISLKNVLDDIPVIFVSCHDAVDLKEGRCIKSHRFFAEDVEYLASSDDGFLGIVYACGSDIYPKRMFTN